jgi:trans-2-enoyl-CoA reductase
LAPEELCLEDVQQLQKLNRELQAENIKKTLSYMMLEQDYYSLKGFKSWAVNVNCSIRLVFIHPLTHIFR